MENEPFDLNEEESLQFQNELDKLKMIAEDGAKFFYGDGMPPEMERDFLNYIRRYEDASRDTKLVSVAELVGYPELRPLSELKEEEIPAELDQVMGMLRSHSIFVESGKPIPPAEMYRFLTETLLPHEMHDMRFEGANWHFIYEEFFPEEG